MLLAWALAPLFVATLLLGAPSGAAAQGRFHGASEADKALEQGARAEQSAAAARRAGKSKQAGELLEKALTEYQRALRLEPAAAAPAARAGYVLYLLGRAAEGLELLDAAAERHPDDMDVLHVLGLTRLKLGRAAAAVAALERVVRKDPDTYYDAAFVLGKHYYEQGDYEAAARNLRIYLKQKPEDHKVHGALGNAYLKQKKYDDALRELREVMRLDPDNVRAPINVGSILYERKEYRRAAAIFEQVLRRRPRKASLHYNIASCHFQLREDEQARRYYESFIALRPKAHVGHFYLAQTLERLRQPGPAAAAYRAAVQVDPKHAETHYRLGLLLARQGADEPAAEALDRAAQLAPEDIWIAAQRANLQRARGATTEALATHRRLVQANPNEPLLRVYLGESLLTAGALKEASDAFAAALAQRPELQPARAGQARVHLARATRAWAAGEAEAAQAEIAAAAALTPEQDVVLKAQALVGARSGSAPQLANARQLLERLGAGRADCPDATLLLAHAEVLLRLGRLEESEQSMQRAGALLERGDPRVVAVRAQLLAASDRPEEALELLEPLAADPASPAGRNVTRLTAALAARLAREGKGRQARALFARAERGIVTLPPEQRGSAQRVMVEALLAQRDYRHALRLLGTLLQPPDGDDDELRYQAAYCYYRLGNPDKAWGHLQALGRRKAEGRYGELTRAVLFRQAGAQIRRRRGKEAQAVLARLRALGAPDSDALRHDAAVATLLSGASAGATATLRTLAQRGTVREAELNLGVLADQAGDSEGAYRHYEAYVRRGGEHADDVRRWVKAKERVFGFGAAGAR